MSLSVGVQGGTGAGKRPPFAAATRSPWSCLCTDAVCPREGQEGATGIIVRRVNAGYLAACPDCGERRPDGPARP